MQERASVAKGLAGTESMDWVNRRSITHVWEMACDAQANSREDFARKGLRAARARDPQLMRVLERGTDVLRVWSAEQEEDRIAHRPDAPKHDATELGMWRAAYESADRGTPMYEMMWVFGAAAHLAGY